MKILIIAPINSIHTIRWVNSLVSLVDELHVASMHELGDKIDSRIILHKLTYKAPLGYFTNYFSLRKIIKNHNFHLIHTHYLSGYGTLSWLTINIKKNNHIISMWGSDIYFFPEKSIFHKKLIERVVNNSNLLVSTSFSMRDYFFKLYPKYIDKKIKVIPFGVDLNKFTKNESQREKNDKFIIGIAKNLKTVYGISYLIKAFYIFNSKYPNSELQIVGDGVLMQELKYLVKELSIEDRVLFYGNVQHELLVTYMKEWNVSVLPSLSESFGVSAVEASACGLPVVASNVGGLPEVIEDGVSGIIIPPKSSRDIADKLEYLYLNPEIAKKMGVNGRKIVEEKYNWNNNVKSMYQLYKRVVNG